MPPNFNPNSGNGFNLNAIKPVPKTPVAPPPVNMVPKAPPTQPPDFLRNAVQQQQQRNIAIEKPGNDPVGNFVLNDLVPSHLIHQFMTLPDAIKAYVAAKTNNPVAYKNADTQLKNEVSNGSGLLNYKQTEHPTAGNIIRGVAESVGQVAPYVVGSGVGGTIDKTLASRGAGTLSRQLIKRLGAASLNEVAGTASGLSTQAGSGKKLNIKSAVEQGVGPAALGAAFPGVRKPEVNKLDHQTFLNGEHNNGVRPTTKFVDQTGPKPTLPKSKESPQPSQALGTPGKAPVATAKPQPQLPKTSWANNTLDKIKGQFNTTARNTTQAFNATLERNLQILRGSHLSNTLRTAKAILQSRVDKGNTENMYHALEDPTLVPGLNKDEKIAFDKVRQIQQETEKINATRQDRKPNTVQNNYVHREAYGKNSRLERFGKGNLASPTQGAMRTTTSDTKGEVYRVLSDGKSRHLVVVKKGRVSGVVNGEQIDFGPKKANLPDQVKESFDPSQRDALDQTARNLGVNHQRVVKLRERSAAGVSYPGTNVIKTRVATPDDTILHELGHQADEKFGIKKLMFGSNKPINDKSLLKQIAGGRAAGSDVSKLQTQLKINKEMRDLADLRKVSGTKSEAAYLRSSSEKVATMFQAYLHAPGLFKKTAPTTFKAFDEFLKSHPEFKPVVDMKPSLKLQSNLVGQTQAPGTFIDRTGKKWNLARATTKEIEANTGTQYSHDAMTNTLLAHADATDAANAARFKDLLQNHPDYSSHIVNGQNTTPPESFKNINSRYFPGFSAKPSTAHLIERYVGDAQMNTSTAGRIYQGINSAAVQAIIMNPGIHGQNLLAQAFIQSGNMPLSKYTGRLQAGPLSTVRLLKASADMVNPETRSTMVHDYLQQGGHFGQYGKDFKSTIAKASGGATKLNARAMSNLDMNIRTLVYHADVRAGMAPAEAVKQIDTHLGQSEVSNKVANNIGMFYNWVRTEAKSGKELVTHPIHNAGAIANAAALVGALSLSNYGLQKVTGNPNAHFRIPGMLSLAHDVYGIGRDLVRGNPNQAFDDAASVATSHLNPVINTALTQAGPSISKFTPNPQAMPTNSERLTEFLNNMVGPASNISKAGAGKISDAQALLASYGGVYVPHATGAPAAPNFKTGPASLINTPGAKNASPITVNGKTVGDKTGYRQEQSYYNSLDALTKQFAGPDQAHSAGLATDFINKDRTPQGKTILLSQSDTEQKWASVKTNLSVLTALQKFYQSQGSTEPQWQLSGTGSISGTTYPKIQIWASYKSLAPTDPGRTTIATQNPWISRVNAADVAWASNQTFSKNVVQSKGYVPLPNFDTGTQGKLNVISNLSQVPAAQRTPGQQDMLITLESDPKVVNAYQQIDNYDNKVSSGSVYPQLKQTPTPSTPLQQFMNQYAAADKATRSAMRSSNSAAYVQMVAYYDTVDIADINRTGATNEFVGEPDQTSSQNKEISSLASDIYNTGSTNAPDYNIVPAGWMYGLTSPSSTTSSYSSSTYNPLSTPVHVSGASTSGYSSLASQLSKSTKTTAGKNVSIKKSYTSGKGNYHVRKVSEPKTEKLTKLPAQKRPGTVYKSGAIKF